MAIPLQPPYPHHRLSKQVAVATARGMLQKGLVLALVGLVFLATTHLHWDHGQQCLLCRLGPALAPLVAGWLTLLIRLPVIHEPLEDHQVAAASQGVAGGLVPRAPPYSSLEPSRRSPTARVS